MPEENRRQRCHVHGGNPVDIRLLHEHHIKPKGYGGEDTGENLIWLCASCHDLVHRMSHMYTTEKRGIANDLAVQYLPGSPAARKRLQVLVAEVANSMKDYVPELEDGDEDDTVIVTLHLPRKVHHRLKTCAADHSMGLYKYIYRVLKNNVTVQLHSAGTHSDTTKKYRTPESDGLPEGDTGDSLLQEME